MSTPSPSFPPEPGLPPELERDLVLSDSRIDTRARVRCPFCWAAHEITLDPGSGPEQEYVEDCPTCCQPWRVVLRYREGLARVVALADDER